MALFTESDGNIFEGHPDILVNPVNCVGVMGAGLAALFKQKYPTMHEEYQHLCRNGLLKPGGIFVHEVIHPTEKRRPWIIISAATKDHWRNQSQYDWVRSIAKALNEWSFFVNAEDETIYIPALGCGLGGLDYKTVHMILYENLVASNFMQVKLFKPR